MTDHMYADTNSSRLSGEDNFQPLNRSNNITRQENLKAWSSFEQTGAISDYLAYCCAIPSYAQKNGEEASDNADHNKRNSYPAKKSWQ